MSKLVKDDLFWLALLSFVMFNIVYVRQLGSEPSIYVLDILALLILIRGLYRLAVNAELIAWVCIFVSLVTVARLFLFTFFGFPDSL